MRCLIIAVVLSVAAHGAAMAGTTVQVSTKTPKISEQVAVKAVQEFVAACRPLTDKYWVDVVSATAVAEDEIASYRERDYGWSSHVEVVVQISNNPSAIPNDVNAWGHRLYYYLGGGKRPGIIAQKRQSQALCGMTPDAGGKDVFKAVPGLSVLDGR
jgi:hypothetical protein